MAALFIIWFGSCVTAPHVGKPFVVERPERMFWEITGTHGTVYIFGTIHALFPNADPIDPKVKQLFETADRIYAEISAEEINALQEKLVPLMMQDSATEGPYSDVTAFLTKKENAKLLEFLGTSGLSRLKHFKPWIINLALSRLLIQQSNVRFDAGVDMPLYKKAEKLHKTVYGLEPAAAQIAFFRMGTYEQQITQLKATIALLDSPKEYAANLSALIEAYMQNDKPELVHQLQLSREREFTDEAYAKEYMQTLFFDRNESWAEKIGQLLELDGDTFIFAGAGHFTVEPTVFDYMEKAGLIAGQKRLEAGK